MGQVLFLSNLPDTTSSSPRIARDEDEDDWSPAPLGERPRSSCSKNAPNQNHGKMTQEQPGNGDVGANVPLLSCLHLWMIDRPTLALVLSLLVIPT